MHLKGPTGLFSYDKLDAIKDFQTDNDLKVDGVIKPNGETMRTLKVQLAPKLKAPAKAEPAEVPEPRPVRIARDASDSAVTDGASGGLLGHAGTKSDTNIPEGPDGRPPETEELAASEPPDFSKAPPKTSMEQGLKPYLDATEAKFDRYENIFIEKRFTNAARFLKHFRGGSGAEL